MPEDNSIICSALEQFESERQAGLQDLDQGLRDLEIAKTALELSKDKFVALGTAIAKYRKQFGCDDDPSYDP